MQRLGRSIGAGRLLEREPRPTTRSPSTLQRAVEQLRLGAEVVLHLRRRHAGLGGDGCGC